MRLDKFQQFVKDGNYEPVLTVPKAKAFIRKIEAEKFAEADDVESNVSGAVGFNDFYKYSLFNIQELSEMKMGEAMQLHANELIKKTLEGIKDMEADDEFEPEDCMDIHHRAEELK